MFRRKKKKGRKRKDYVGNYLTNSRITIDYTKKKPTVKFSYPSKRNPPALISPIGTPIFLILYLFTAWFLALYDFPEANRPITIDDCNITKNQEEGLLTNISIVCNYDNNQSFYKTYELDRGESLGPFKMNPDLTWAADPDNNASNARRDGYLNSIFFLLKLSIVFGVWIVAGYLVQLFCTKTKLGGKWFPEVSKKFADAKYYLKIDKLNSKTFELPLFKNIYMDYTARKEFAKYLERIVIKEHPFNKLVKKLRRGKNKKKPRYKKKKQDLLWKATFYFSKVPKEGYLEMWWT